MALFRHAIPRRALVGAVVGAVYGFLLLVAIPLDGFPLLPLGLAVGWFLLSIGLLFLQPLSFTAFTSYALLWIVWRGILYVRAGTTPFLQFFADDVLLPLLALILVGTSGYLAHAHAAREADSAD